MIFSNYGFFFFAIALQDLFFQVSQTLFLPLKYGCLASEMRPEEAGPGQHDVSIMVRAHCITNEKLW